MFILSPLTTCLVGADFASGNVCRGTDCADCACAPEEFDPPAPLHGLTPAEAAALPADSPDPVCVEISLTPDEIDDITRDLELVRDRVLEWTGGALELQLDIRVMPHDFTGFVAPEFVIGPFEIDDELVNPYVTTKTDFVYVVTGVHDRSQALRLAYYCGGSYGAMTVHGAGYSYIQYGEACASVSIGAGRSTSR